VERADGESLREVAESMMALNKLAGEGMVRLGAHAATDVTGFSLMGHMAEIVRSSDVEAVIDFDQLPLFSGVAALARQDVIPGAVERNRESVEEGMLDVAALTMAQRAILFCPETSGGLLVFLPQEQAEEYVRQLKDRGVNACVIGHVKGQCADGKITVTTSKARDYAPIALTRNLEPESCCAQAAGDRGSAGASPSREQAGTMADGLPAPAAADAFKQYMAAVSGAGALGVKEKKLIGLALSVMSKCEPCVKIHARAAREAGASEEQIAEAVAMGIAFGGAPVAMFYNTMRI
jgi:AhpD family alkylhydroperoxidase